MTGGLQGTESEMTSLEKDMVRNDNSREMTTPEIGRQDAVLHFFWGDIAVVFKQALKERSRLCESWFRL